VSGSTASNDLRSPLARARDKWLASEEGKRCLDTGILWSPHQTQYLENRLVTAFLAGAKWAEGQRYDQALPRLPEAGAERKGKHE
jgi:hypothetical protein